VRRAEARSRRTARIAAIVGAFALAACDVATVRKLDPVTGKAIIEEEHQAFDARTFVATNWTSRVLPEVQRRAVALPVLRRALADDRAAAVTRYGNGGTGGRASFLVSGTARVLDVDTLSRSGVARLDLEPYDGTPDAELQIGPVLRGTALRDALPFIRFDDFTNQMEYASVSRVLHERIADSLLAKVNRATLAGRVIQFSGAFTEGAGLPLVTPVTLQPVR
jgi:predicted lipoprotein